MEQPPFIRECLHYLGGVSDACPVPLRPRTRTLLLAVWWAFLGIVIAIFGGQTSKFIYIDF